MFCVLAQVQMSTIAYSDRILVDISTNHIFWSGGHQGYNSGCMHLDNSTIDAHLHFCGRNYFQNFHLHSNYYELAKSPTQPPENRVVFTVAPLGGKDKACTVDIYNLVKSNSQVQ